MDEASVEVLTAGEKAKRCHTEYKNINGYDWFLGKGF